MRSAAATEESTPPLMATATGPRDGSGASVAVDVLPAGVLAPVRAGVPAGVPLGVTLLAFLLVGMGVEARAVVRDHARGDGLAALADEVVVDRTLEAVGC